MVENHAFKWASPPPKRSGRHAKAYLLAKRIASRPNEWARIAKYKGYQTAATRAHDIRSGKIQAWAEVGKFEAMVRQTDKNEYSVFTRCVYVKKGVDFDE